MGDAMPLLPIGIIGALLAGAAVMKNPPLLGTPIPSLLVAPIIGGVLGYYFPNMWLNSKIRARQKEIQLALADALDLMVISVEAGLGFDASMAKVAEKWDNAL